MKRRQEAAEAEERARREAEEAERQAAIAAAQAAAQQEAGADRPDMASPSADDRSGKKKFFLKIFALLYINIEFNYFEVLSTTAENLKIVFYLQVKGNLRFLLLGFLRNLSLVLKSIHF